MSKASADHTFTPSANSPCSTVLALRNTTKLDPLGVIIPDTSVSVDFFKTMLANFKIESSIDQDGELNIPEAFGPFVYLRVNTERHWVILHGGVDTPMLTIDDRLELANSLNSDLAMAQFGATDRGIGMAFFMYYRGGLNLDQFMTMAQRFGSLAFTVMRRYAVFGADESNSSAERDTGATLN